MRGTKLTDGTRTVTITMQTWDGNNYSPDFSYDFFEVGALERADEETYIVEDVEYCIDQAEDWEAEAAENVVFIEEEGEDA